MPEKIPVAKLEAQESEETPQEKDNLELEPLNEKEKEELSNLFIKFKSASKHGSPSLEYQREIAEKFGERAVLHLVENYKELGMDPTDSVNFFDSLATEKTGRLKVSYHESFDSWDEIEAWVINQAIIRNFAPRQEKR